LKAIGLYVQESSLEGKKKNISQFTGGTELENCIKQTTKFVNWRPSNYKEGGGNAEQVPTLLKKVGGRNTKRITQKKGGNEIQECRAR